MQYDIRLIPDDRITVAPSILAADFGTLAADVDKVAVAGADLLHLDVMDGHFVPNISFGPGVIQALAKRKNLCFDTHLMISRPLRYIGDFARSGADHITFHVECDNEIREVIREIRRFGCTVGLSLKPRTPAAALLPYLEDLDLVLIMSVEPGFGGQSFMTDMMDKVREVRRMIDASGRKIHLEIDGGIDCRTVAVAAAAGANMMVAGTAVFRATDGMKKALETLHATSRAGADLS